MGGIRKMTDFKNYLKEQLDNDPELKAEYDALKPEFDLISQIIKFRNENNLTQKELADIIGTKQSNISRLESGEYNPSLDFLKKVAKGLGKEIKIELV